MIKIRFLENNIMLIRFNGDKKYFIWYVTIMLKRFSYCSKPHKGGGWELHYNKLSDIQKAFKDIVYENEYTPPVYAEMGKDMKLQPYDYQKEAIYFAVENREALLVLPCGSGKTPIMIGSYLECKDRDIINGPGMIVVKASLKSQWKKEIEKFSDLSANIILTYSDCVSSYVNRIKARQTKLSKLDPLKDLTAREKIANEIKELTIQAEKIFSAQFDNYDLFVVNYETLNDDKVREQLKKRGIDFIGADEIHYCKSKDADRSKSLYEFNEATIKIGATATPITKDPRDVFGIYKFVNPDIFSSYTNFTKLYIKYAGFGRISEFRNIDNLKDKIRNNIFVKTKRDVSGQLPKLAVRQKYCDLTNEQQEVYDRILCDLDALKEQDFKIRSKCKSETEAELNSELQKISMKILALQTFGQELADSPVLLSSSDSEMAKSYTCKPTSPKLELCAEMVDEILQSGEKVIIFSRYERMQSILTDRISKIDKSIKIAYVNGSLSSERRYEEAYTKFKEDPEYKVLLCSDAGAEGLNMGHCKYLIEYDLAISYAMQTQRHGRLERADSVHSNVTVYQLIANNSWDEIQARIVEKKEGYDIEIIKSLC